MIPVEDRAKIIEQRLSFREHPLAKFGVELTALARRGELDPVIGRDQQTQRVIEILSRRKKNNPILVGEAGVGKSAIAEGLALRIVSGDVPHTIKNKRLFSIDITALVAGTKFRGEFEERMQQLLLILKESKDTIIFIDEVHTIVGAGSTQGSLDTANILKPALARGEIQLIGATTFDEYRNNIETDAALVRRMQRVVVEPTNIEQSIEILRRIAHKYESHHSVKYTEEALEACVHLSERYITDRNLPDKAIDLMDEAGARANILGAKSSDCVSIDSVDIEQIITSLMGVPVQSLSSDEITRLQRVEAELQSRVVGQDDAVKRVARTIRRSRSGLADSARPMGVFLFVGPSGVGKTLLAKELSRSIFYGDRSLVRVDMSEYGEKHNVARLVGSPPGYVGYGEGGELSEAVRRNPYSVVLLDEIEKAHPDVFNIMLQIFDEGALTDAAGRRIDFRNTIIIITSNAGSRGIEASRKKVGYATTSKMKAERESDEASYKRALEQLFAPEFLNRIDETVIFRTLEQCDIEGIVKIELEKIFERVRALGYGVRATRGAQRELARMSCSAKFGARELRRTLAHQVEEPISDFIINGDIAKGASVVVELERKGRGLRLRIA